MESYDSTTTGSSKMASRFCPAILRDRVNPDSDLVRGGSPVVLILVGKEAGAGASSFGAAAASEDPLAIVVLSAVSGAVALDVRTVPSVGDRSLVTVSGLVILSMCATLLGGSAGDSPCPIPDAVLSLKVLVLIVGRRSDPSADTVPLLLQFALDVPDVIWL
jgi:hypothetical protein